MIYFQEVNKFESKGPGLRFVRIATGTDENDVANPFVVEEKPGDLTRFSVFL